MMYTIYKLIVIALLVGTACSAPEAPQADPLMEALPSDDSNAGEPRETEGLTNAGEPARPRALDTAVGASTCAPGSNGGWHYCSAECPCEAGEGDCDGNDECAAGLTCVKNIGATYGWDADVDVCELTCHPSANGGWHYCSAECPCEAREGDCDGDDECAPGLICVKNVGLTYGWDEDVDVCEASCNDTDPGTCSPGCPCDGEPRGTSLFLQVLDLEGQPIPTAAVTAQGTLRATDGAGRILLEELPAGRVVARVDAQGFASASVAVDLPAGAHGGSEVRLRPLGTPVPFDATTGATLNAPGDQPAARVTIPPGALVDYNGEPVTGTVEATIVSLDPSQATADALPGPLQARRAGTGAVVELESIMMVEVSLWQNGLPVHLAPGAKATLELVLPEAVDSRFQAGDTIEAWWLDLDAGVWQEECVGTIRPSSQDPAKLAWVVEVGHFTWWNLAEPWTDKNCFDVTVVDELGNPVADVRVGAEGVSYAGVFTPRVTEGDGRACVDTKLGETADILVGSWVSPLVPVHRVTGSGPAGDCAGMGAACTSITVVVPSGVMICVPGTSRSCPYSGPAGTEGVGLCQAGADYCSPDGTIWSGCTGEVVPAAETCATPFDEDCDGAANEAGGMDCECSDGDTTACYSGPPDTLDVGVCQAGVRTCIPSLGRFGPCEGQVLPQQELCATAEDDDCDGSTGCTWSRQFGGDRVAATGMATDSAGNVLVVGDFENFINLFGQRLFPSGWQDLFVAKLDWNGNRVWTRHYRGSSSGSSDVAVDAANNVLIAGTFWNTVDFGGGPLAGAGGDDVVVAKLDADGNHLWSRRFGDADRQRATSLAVDGGGNTLVAGHFSGTVDFGGGPLVSAAGSDIFVAKLDARGNYLWSHGFSGVTGFDIALDPAGNVVAAGDFSGAVDFGGGPLVSAGGSDIFVTKWDAYGAHLWSRRYGNVDDQSIEALAVDPAGSILVAGGLENAVDFGDGPLVSAGSSDVFVVKLSAAGNHLWSRHYGDAAWQSATSLATDAAGNVLMAGQFSGTVDFGGGPLASTERSATFVVKLDASGNHSWGRRFDAPSDAVHAIAEGAGDGVLIMGRFNGTIDFGSGPLTGNEEQDWFLAKLAP